MPFSPAKLRDLRTARRMSQTQLAQAAGLRQPAVARLEAGRIANPTIATLERLAAALRIKPAELLE